ncbi:MAG: EpsG family protein [Clostridia bacterium]|nr:EpsG family protein [Clostridia bacterium]
MVYVGILLVMVLLRLCLPQDTQKNRRIFVGTCCMLFVLFAACRAPEVGRDTALFLDVFDKLHGRGFLDTQIFSSWVEPGFRLLCWLLAQFTSNGQWLVVVTSVIIHVSVCVFIYRHTQNPYLACFLYLTLMLYPWYLNVMRQALAISVLLFAWGAFRQKHFLRFSFLVLLAATFHTSALMFLLCPLLTLIPVSKKSLRILLPATVLLAVAGAVFVRPLLGWVTALLPRYADYEPTTFLALYGFLALFVIVTGYGVWRLYYAKTATTAEIIKGRVDECGFLTLMMLIGVVVAAMMTQFGQLQRVFNYFEVFYLLWLPMVVPPAFFEKKHKHLAFPVVEIVVLLVALAYFFFILFARSALWYDALPYRFFWQ